MLILYRIILILIFVFYGLTNSFGQTCCTAGAPVGAFLGIQNTTEKSLSFQLAYEYNSINLLIDNNDVIENDPRTRFGQNVSFKVDYALNKKFAFSVITPFVQQSRSTFSDNQSSLGLGDIIFLTQYSLIDDALSNLSVSAGIKLPTGITKHRATSGILLSPDMQSGSGSTDFVARIAYSKNNFLAPFLTGYANSAFRKNGTNKDFGSTNTFQGRQFAFGDESTTQIGLRYLITMKQGFLNPDIAIKMRWTESNSEQNVNAPNSGGYWISIPFGLSFSPDDKKSIALSAEIPAYQQLDGLQITTNFKFGIQVNYTIQPNKNDSLIN